MTTSPPMSTPPPQTVADRLPPQMWFGTATSSAQVEGAHDADGKGPSIWDTFARRPGTIADGSTPAGACDHYHRVESDVGLMADLGMEAYRFSVAWPRVLPEGRGQVEPRGLAFYDRLVDALLSAGIEPVPTLYHWDLPQALQDAGGWPSRDTAGRFADYAHVVVSHLGDRVRRWATLNEPWCSAHLGHHAGVHAPGHRDAGEAMAAAHTLLRAHHLGGQAIRAARSDAMVGIALNLTTLHPAEDTDADLDAVRAMDAIHNRWWLDGVLEGRLPDDAVAAWEAVASPDVRDGDLDGPRPDWLGINYYFPEVVTARPDGAPLADACVDPARAVPPSTTEQSTEVTAMGWRVDPSGLTALLRRVHDDHGPIPIVITENGSAYDDHDPRDGRVADPLRTDYLSRHLLAVADAVDAGVPVEGYLAWSLLDNWEWALGYSKRFGIVHVDYATQVRTPKDSARWYAELVQAVRARRR